MLGWTLGGGKYRLPQHLIEERCMAHDLVSHPSCILRFFPSNISKGLWVQPSGGGERGRSEKGVDENGGAGKRTRI